MANTNRTIRARSTPRRAVTRREHLERVTRALVYAETRLSGELSLERLAGHVSMSPFHFQRAFAAVVGETPAGYIRRLRVEAAATLLLRGWSVPRALHAQVGYPRAEPFIRAFKQRFGKTPTEYRRTSRSSERVGKPPAGMRSWTNQADGTDVLRMGLGPVRAGQSCVSAAWFGPVRAAFIRCVGERVDWRATMERLLEWAWQHGRISSQPLCMLMAHDDADVTERPRRRVDCCVVVAPRTRASGEVGIRSIPRGTYAIATVAGGDDMVTKAEAWVARAAEQETRMSLGVGARLRIVLPPTRGRMGARRGGELTDVLVPLKHDEDLMQIYFRRVRGEWTMKDVGQPRKRSRA